MDTYARGIRLALPTTGALKSDECGRVVKTDLECVPWGIAFIERLNGRLTGGEAKRGGARDLLHRARGLCWNRS